MDNVKNWRFEDGRWLYGDKTTDYASMVRRGSDWMAYVLGPDLQDGAILASGAEAHVKSAVEERFA